MSEETAVQEERRAAVFDEHRRYLFAVAYRMLGIAEDAEDMVQDTWLRFSDVNVDTIEHPRTYLVTITTRLCIDSLRSARTRREEYVGVWLPEPVSTDEATADGLLDSAETASFAFLLMLERLSPLQRAVLVLYDVFDFTHEEVAAAIGGTVAASRQALRRARKAVDDAELPAAPTPKGGAMVKRFLDASRRGDVAGLMKLLAPEIVLLSDGGGKVAASPYPLEGSEMVAGFFASVGPKGTAAGAEVSFGELNGQPAMFVHEDGELTNAMAFDVRDEQIETIYVVRNPDKLGRVSGTDD